MSSAVPTRPSVARPAGETLHEVTRSICPVCRAAIDAQVLLRDGEVFLRKRCADHGWFEGLIYADARAYVEQAEPSTTGTTHGSSLDIGTANKLMARPDASIVAKTPSSTANPRRAILDHRSVPRAGSPRCRS